MFVLAVVLLCVANASAQHVCTGVGYYPDPADCSKFYRCTDIWMVGSYQQYTFMCPPGTVFDDRVDVCNWPMAVPGCGTGTPTATTAAPTEATTTASTVTSPASVEQPYVPSPNSEYACVEPGIVKYEPDCQKFWLCKEKPEGSRILESLLYRCPEGYRFSSSILRCDKIENTTCQSKEPQIESRHAPVYQLTIDELDSFFARWN